MWCVGVGVGGSVSVGVGVGVSVGVAHNGTTSQRTTHDARRTTHKRIEIEILIVRFERAPSAYIEHTVSIH